MSSNTVISYPVPPFSNPPIHPEFYIPQRFRIVAIAQGLTTIITTATPHDYVIGQEIRLIIPPGYGSRELNEKRAYVISIPSDTQVEITLDTLRDVNAFINADLRNVPQILAIGDVNNGAINAFGSQYQTTYIPGSFRDISP